MKFIKKNLFSLVAILFAVVAIILCFAPFITNTTELLGSKITTNYSGFAVMFGGEGVVSSGSSSTSALETKVVVTALIAFILMVLGLIAVVASLVLKVKFNKLIAFVGAGLLVAAGIMLFFTQGSFVAVNEIGETLGKYYSLGAGAVIDAILLIIAGAAELVGMLNLVKIK